jgi:hypothetical protein
MYGTALLVPACYACTTKIKLFPELSKAENASKTHIGKVYFLPTPVLPVSSTNFQLPSFCFFHILI